MPVFAPPDRTRPVWDCHICGTTDAFTGHPVSCTTVIESDGSSTGGLYHDDGTLCRWYRPSLNSAPIHIN